MDNIMIHNFKGYILFIVIIKYWLYSWCCSLYPCSLFYAQQFVPLNPLSLYCPPPPTYFSPLITTGLQISSILLNIDSLYEQQLVQCTNIYLLHNMCQTLFQKLCYKSEQTRQNLLHSEEYIEVGGDRQNSKYLKKIENVLYQIKQKKNKTGKMNIECNGG